MGKRAREFSVGAIVSIAIVIFAVAVMAISKESRLFVPKVRYWTTFDNTSGLTTGSPVRLVGVQIGTVERIEFDTATDETRIRVEFTVAREFSGRIREGTQAYLKSLTYLSQDKYIELVPGPPENPPLPVQSLIEPGASIWEQTLERGQSIAEDVKEITASLRQLLVGVNRGGGVVQEMIHNPDFGRRGVEDFEESMASLNRVLKSIEDGKGLASHILTDEQFARRQMDSIEHTLERLRTVADRLDSDEGFVSQLSSPDGDARQALADLRAGAASLRDAAAKFERGEGLVGRLLNDEEYADSLLTKIESTIGHAESVLEKIDGGEGTLGGIVNDPAVLEGLKDIVAGVRKSRMGKGMLRHYEKKGAKIRDKQSESEAGDKEEEEDDDPDFGPTP